jgi:hypothetical protein
MEAPFIAKAQRFWEIAIKAKWSFDETGLLSIT